MAIKCFGALGRRLESCRTDHLKTQSTSQLVRLAFLLLTVSPSKGGMRLNYSDVFDVNFLKKKRLNLI